MKAGSPKASGGGGGQMKTYIMHPVIDGIVPMKAFNELPEASDLPPYWQIKDPRYQLSMAVMYSHAYLQELRTYTLERKRVRCPGVERDAAVYILSENTDLFEARIALLNMVIRLTQFIRTYATPVARRTSRRP
jgi:hypothetical protein